MLLNNNRAKNFQSYSNEEDFDNAERRRFEQCK